MDNFYFMCFSETKVDFLDKEDLPSGLNVITKRKISRELKLGGYHGLCVIFKDTYSDAVKQLECGLTADSVLWLFINERVLGFSFILGCVYIPHEGSKYHTSDIFETISDDIVYLKGRYDAPICLTGDFNSRIGKLDDFMENDFFEIDNIF